MKNSGHERPVTYLEAIQFLQSLQMFGSQFGLERAIRLAELAGHPQDRLRFIHVAGTNGKGSTCAMLEAIYRTAGLRVGLYTSPHLVSFRERIQIDRELVSESAAALLAQQAQGWLKALPPKEHATFFEVVTVMALRYFADQRCDMVVWETGLGGRLDATNIVTPLASVITNVQFDHEKWLGHTLEQIASEKSGIIKPHVPVVTAAQDGPVLRVIREKAAQQGAPLHVVQAPLEGRAMALEGIHQRLNAALALKTVEILRPAIPVSEQAMAAGLSSVRWPGRFQIIRRGPQTFVLDGAHNPDGAAALVATFRAKFPGPATLIAGILEDKNIPQICETLGSIASRIIAVPVANSRTASAEKLAGIFRSSQPAAVIMTARSLAEALAQAHQDRLVLVSGSLYLIGEALEFLGEVPASGERALNDWSARPR